MHEDEIMADVRAVRDALAARHDYDVRALYEAARERAQKSQRKVVKLSPRQLAPEREDPH